MSGVLCWVDVGLVVAYRIMQNPTPEENEMRAPWNHELDEEMYERCVQATYEKQIKNHIVFHNCRHL